MAVPQLMLGRTVGAGHFHQLEVPDQVDAMIDRFLTVADHRPHGTTLTPATRDKSGFTCETPSESLLIMDREDQAETATPSESAPANFGAPFS